MATEMLCIRKGASLGLGLAWMCSCLLTTLPNEALADSTHYQTLQLGERSRGMASAYTGYAADGAAIWFNPAGLPLLEPKLLQGSLSLGVIRRLKIEDAVVGPVSTEDFTIKSTPTLPGFAVASFALGKKKIGGSKVVQVAISAFQTYNEELSGDIQVADALGRTNSIEFGQIDRNTFIAAGVGWRFRKNTSIGITALANNRVLRHNENISFAFGGRPDSDPDPERTSPPHYLDARQINRTTQFDMNAWNMIFRLGVMQLFGEHWRLGVMFQTPGIPMGGKADLRAQLSDVDARLDPAPSDSYFLDGEGFKANNPTPWELRLGTSWVMSKRAVVAADLQLVGPVKSGSIAENVPQAPGRLQSEGVLLDTSTKRDFVWNVSVGTAIEITPWLYTSFGFLTDRSAAPSVSGTSSEVRATSGVDRYGFSASVGGHKEERGLSVGFSGLWGKGTGNGIDVREEALAGNQGFRRVNIKDRSFIISIGGDVGKAAKVVKEELKEKKTLPQEAQTPEQATPSEPSEPSGTRGAEEVPGPPVMPEPTTEPQGN